MRKLLGLLWFLWALPAFALSPEQETRALNLEKEIRCVVCQGQSIADSDADVANDLKREIRTLIANGRSDDDIRSALQQQYGDFILFRPRLSPLTGLLWALPPLLALLGLWLWWRQKKPASGGISVLSDEEKSKIARLLGHKDTKDEK